MNIRKSAVIFLLSLGLTCSVPAVSFSADTTTQLYVTGTSLISPDLVTQYVPAVISTDGTTIITPEQKGAYTFPAPSSSHYGFAAVTDALNFALDADGYIGSNYTGFNTASFDYTYDSSLQSVIDPVTVTITTGSISSTQNLTGYSAITDITITASPVTLTAPSGSRHFTLGSTSKVTFSGITFSPNADATGGGVQVSSGTAVFSGVTFNSCQTTGNGGGILVTGGSATIGSSSAFSNCTANYGGGLAVTGGTATVSETTFTGNSATSYGGAVYSSSALTVGANVLFNTESVYSPNSADRGGAVYVASGTTNISGANIGFTENAANYGAGLYAAGGTVNISGAAATFKGNIASNDGGAIYAGTGATLNLTGDDLTLDSNYAATNGGGIFLGTNVNLTLSSSASTLKGNSASSNGGALYASGGNRISLSGAATFTNNTANLGGAIYLASARNVTQLNITGTSASTFSGNDASTSGGAIYAESNATMTFEPEVTFNGNNARNGNGGAIWVTELTQLPEGKVFFEGNTAAKTSGTSSTEGSGGAIYAQGSGSSSVIIGTTKIYTFTDNNTAQSYGGAFCSNSGDVTFESYTGDRSVTARNTAWLGGGFAASYTGIIRVNNSSIMNQVASRGSGGAIWSKHIVVTSSDFGSSSYPNESQGSGNSQGGGAIYSNGTVSLTNSTFSYNTATQGGGAVYADTAEVTIRDSYFHNNRAQGGNGGAVTLRNYCTTSVSNTTFASNTSENLDGGALYAQGKIEINLCYFYENLSRRSGGAVYFDQSTAQEPYASFSLTDSMFTDNSTLGGTEGGNGGAVFVAANVATVKSSTFNKNHLDLSGNAGEGGALYLNTASYQSATNRIENCTFYDNAVNDGAAPSSGTTGGSGGGALGVHCEGRTEVVSCTFSMNASRYKGGAIYLGAEDGTLSLSGVLAVGNVSSGIYDIWSDGNIASGGYNRIGVYGTGSGVTDFYSETRNETDRTSYPAKGWTKETFFSGNVLAVNARTDLGGNIPPYLGSTRAGQVRLLTLMLSEDATLPLTDRATNVIPYSRRTSFPNVDERGVSRVSRGAEIALDVGAVFFDGTRPSQSSDVISSYTITRVEISGIPNNLRRVGQTASLIAKVYYSNGRTALGGTGTGEEPVEWLSDKPNIIRINKDTGDITVLNFTPNNTYVTITARTLRTDLSGNQISDSKAIRVTEYTYSYLNTSPAILNYLQSYVEGLAEYDISMMIADLNAAIISASSFQTAFAALWGGVSASQVTDLTNGSLTFERPSSYSTSDGFRAAKAAGVNINFSGRNKGDLLPLTYSWTFTGEELRKILSYDLTGKSLTDETVDNIFSSLRLDFQGALNSVPVIGGNGVKASTARSAGVLTLAKADGEKGLRAELTAYLANVSTSSTTGTGVARAANDGPQILKSGGTSVLVVPDGSGTDSAIYGTMWAANKTGSSGTQTPNNSNGNSNQTQTRSSGSGGGGCNSMGMIIPVIALMFVIKRK